MQRFNGTVFLIINIGRITYKNVLFPTTIRAVAEREEEKEKALENLANHHEDVCKIVIATNDYKDSVLYCIKHHPTIVKQTKIAGLIVTNKIKNGKFQFSCP